MRFFYLFCYDQKVIHSLIKELEICTAALWVLPISFKNELLVRLPTRNTHSCLDYVSNML